MGFVKSKISGPFKVYLGIVPTGYLDPSAIYTHTYHGLVFTRGLQAFELMQGSKMITLNPDLCYANSKLSPYGYTHNEIIMGALKCIFESNNEAKTQLLLSQNTWGVPAISVAKSAGYFKLGNFFSKRKLKIIDQSKIPNDNFRFKLSKPSHQIHELTAPGCIAKSDLIISLPKIRNDVITNGFAGALTQTLDLISNSNLDDLKNYCEVYFPNFIISDGIILPWGGTFSSPKGFDLNVILVANNPVAHDIVASHLLGHSIDDISYLESVIDDGWGPSNLQQIDIGGAGIEGLNMLTQKFRSWQRLSHRPNVPKCLHDLSGYLPLNRIEILPILSTKSILEKKLIHWFLLFLDGKHYSDHSDGSAWPKLSIIFDNETNYPKHKTVFCLGQNSMNCLKSITSETYLNFSFLGIIIKKLKLKNSKIHWCLLLPEFNFFKVSLIFWMLSLGQIRSPFLTIKILFWNVLSFLSSFSSGSSVKSKKIPPRFLAAKLPQNEWWNTTS